MQKYDNYSFFTISGNTITLDIDHYSVGSEVTTTAYWAVTAIGEPK